MRIELTVCGLALAALMTSPVLAQGSGAAVIVDVVGNGDVHIYDDAFEELYTVPANALKAALNQQVTVEGQSYTGLPILEHNEGEGMYKVSLEDHGTVWVEELVFEVKPDRVIECSASVQSLAEETQSDGTVGFGGC